MKILAKPRAAYTTKARSDNVQGTVVLKVQFRGDGTIGAISVVKGLPYVLTEQSIAAAREIRFEPARVDGKPVTVSKTIEYTFLVY